MQLGKLKEIDIRKVWQREQYDLSKWLSSLGSSCWLRAMRSEKSFGVS